MKTPRISDCEWEVMKIVWDKEAVRSIEVAESLKKRWHPKTTKTLLGRLVRKGALKFEEQGRAYLYKPAVNEAACVRAECEAFFDRVLRGSFGMLLTNFVATKKLAPEDVHELKRLLRENGK